MIVDDIEELLTQTELDFLQRQFESLSRKLRAIEKSSTTEDGKEILENIQSTTQRINSLKTKRFEE